MSEQPQSSDLKSFWQIDFRVVAGKIRLVQTVSLWLVRPNETPVRVGSKEWNLKWTQVGPGTLTTEDDHIVCDNAGLVCQTVDLEDAMAELSGVQSRGSHGVSISDAISGKENVSLQAIVDIPAAEAPHHLDGTLETIRSRAHAYRPQTAPETPNRFHPIFFLEQPAGYIMLGEAEDQGNRYMVWTIDPAPESTPRGGILPESQPRGSTPAFQLDGWHRLRVHQDGEQLSEGDYFEYWVDQLAFGRMELTTPNFPFNRLPSRFYIGAFPKSNVPNDVHCIKGKIRHLFFDPNDVCWGCFT